jgi:lambda family phage portal protein
MPVSGLREVHTPRHRHGFLERAARVIAPGFVQRRERARLAIRQSEVQMRALDQLEKQLGTGYAGASKTRGQSMWNPGEGSADEDILAGLGDLRARSRDLIRNDPHAAGIVDVWCNNIIGHGMTPQSRVDHEEIGITPEAAGEFQRTAERLFMRWAKTADYTGLRSFAEIQELVLRQVFENGDVFVVPRSVPWRKYALALELIEADRVTTPAKFLTDGSVREGVVIGKFGEPVAYYVKKTHPGDVAGVMKTDDFIRVDLFDPDTGKQNIHHLFRPLRPGQSRGVPALAPALPMFRDLQQYMKAELIGAKVAACFAVFIQTPDPFGDAARATSSITNGKQNELLEPGMIRRLNVGETVTGFAPNRPATNYDIFVMRHLRSIGMCIGTPLELVSMDFSQTNYTSGRMALTEVRRTYKKVQRWIAEKFCQPVWERILTEAVLQGDLEIDGASFTEFFDAWTRCTWVGPGWAWVDPQKEVAATVESMTANLSTLADECASRGLDWEDVLEQRARETTREKELGIDQKPEPPPGFGPPGEEDPEAEEDKPAAVGAGKGADEKPFD